MNTLQAMTDPRTAALLAELEADMSFENGAKFLKIAADYFAETRKKYTKGKQRILPESHTVLAVFRIAKTTPVKIRSPQITRRKDIDSSRKTTPP